MDVGIRELKAKLSEYVERAAKGETIRVTARGKPRAVIGPIPGSEERDPAIQRGIDEGWITPGDGSAPEFREPPARSRLTIAEVLAEDRGD